MKNVQLLAVMIPALATVLVAVIGAVVTITGRNREQRVSDIYIAFEYRGKVIQAKDERIQELEEQLRECKESTKRKKKSA